MSTTQLSRRTLLKAGALTGAGLAIPWRWLASAPPTRAASSQNLRKFVQPLRNARAAGIPLAQPDTMKQSWWQPGVTHYSIDIGEYSDQLHPDLPNPTRLWGFGQGPRTSWRHLGGIIAAKRGSPVQITFRNKLPTRHILPVDRTIMGTEDADNRADVHLHGGLVPWTSDGGPFAWWDPNGNIGPSFLNNSVLRRSPPGGQRRRVLLPQQPGRPARLVPRPLDRDHAAERLRRHRLRVRHLRRLRARPGPEAVLPARPPRPAHRLPGLPGEGVRVGDDRAGRPDLVHGAARLAAGRPLVRPHLRPGRPLGPAASGRPGPAGRFRACPSSSATRRS